MKNTGARLAGDGREGAKKSGVCGDKPHEQTESPSP